MISYYTNVFLFLQLKLSIRSVSGEVSLKFHDPMASAICGGRAGSQRLRHDDPRPAGRDQNSAYVNFGAVDSGANIT
jgi:hypothetical protein